MSSPDRMSPKDEEGNAKTKGSQKKVSEKDVDLTSGNRGVWLVKVPNYIAERWENVANDNSTVGKLTIQRLPGEKPKVTLNLDDEITRPLAEPPKEWSTTKGKIPKEHQFVINPVSAQHLAILSHTKAAAANAEGSKLSVEGRVIQRAECRALDQGLYMRLKREALLKPVEDARKAQKINKLVINFKPKANHANNIAYDRKVKEEGKKSRDDKEAVMEKLFALFEKHQYYNFRDLVKETRQPVPYLKMILNEVCKYNLKNPHRNMWELKPEYRHYKAEVPTEDDDTAKDSDSD